MILNVIKTTIIFFSCKTVDINFNCKLCNNPILHPDVSKFLEYCWNASCIFITALTTISFKGLKMLGLIYFIISSFSTPYSLCVLYTTFVQPKLEYAFVAWNTITLLDSSNLERVKEIYALCHSRFFEGICCSNCQGIVARLNISTLYSKQRHLHTIFLLIY